MASFYGTRFPGPMFNQNIVRSNFNMNPVGDRHPRPPFQRPPSSPYRPIQPPERFMHGSFQNRPQFSNFPEAVATSGFRNRVPPPNEIFRLNSPPPNQMFRMNSPPPNQGFRMNSPPPNQGYQMKSLPPNQAFRMKSPPPVPRPHFSGHFEHPFRPWNQTPYFGVPKSPFQNRPRPPVQSPSNQSNMPLQTNKKRKQKTREFRKLKSWMTDELFLEVKKKNALYLKAKSSDEQTAWQEFRLQRNRVSSLIKEAKIKAGLISRKIKEEDTTEKPFSCDTCDRAFVSEDELKDHLSQHIKCDHEDCMFEAHPKIVALHQKMQHDTGYADRINKLQDEEEIKRWREERKRRFPTAENIKKRKAEQAEKEARGEVLETKEFGKFKRRREGIKDVVNNDTGRRMRNHGPKRFNRRRNHNNHPYSRPLTVNIDSESDSDNDSHITLNTFSGMSSLSNPSQNMHNLVEDVNIFSGSHTINNTAKEKSSCEQNLPESDSDHKITHLDISYAGNVSKEKTDQTSFLLNDNIHDLASPANESICEISVKEVSSGNPEVVDLEDSESPANEVLSEKPEVVILEDSDNESPASVQIIKSVEKAVVENDSDSEGPVVVPVVKSEIKFITNDDKGLETTKTQFHGVDESKEKTKLNVKVDKPNRGLRKEHVNMNGLSNRQDHIFQARKSTLLEKLLADDIRHERNVILQCIRHIVNNNFFGIGCKK